MLAALLACDGSNPSLNWPEPVDAPSETGHETSETGDDTSEPVTSSAALPAAEWAGGPASGWTGYELAAGRMAGTEVVLVGSPILPGPLYLLDPQVAALVPTASELDWMGSFEDPDGGGGVPSSGFGTSIAIGDGTQFAVGAPNGAVTADQAGTVFLIDGLPDGIETVTPTALLHGTLNRTAQFGVAVIFVTDGSDSALVASASGGDSLGGAGIYRFDSALVGEHGLEAATASISGGARLGQYLAAWDSDGDGVDELIAAVASGVAHFAMPWEGTLTEADADVVWTDLDPLNQLGEPLQTLGDVDGDGAPDLAIGAQTYSGAEVRSGAMYIVPAGRLDSSTAADLPMQFHGTELGEGVGSAAASGDYDGDGATDVVVGAYGIPPGRHTGKVLGYLGPLEPGTRLPADADFAVAGERAFDWFGCDVVTVVADGDAHDDIVVGAQGWSGGDGKVYLCARMMGLGYVTATFGRALFDLSSHHRPWRVRPERKLRPRDPDDPYVIALLRYGLALAEWEDSRAG